MSDNKNLNDNRIRIEIQNDRTKGTLGDVQLHSFSADKNRRVEQACAVPDYSEYTRAGAGAPIADDANPNTGAPGAANLWDLKGFWGLHGYIEFTGGALPTASVALWARDDSDGHDNYFLVQTIHGVADRVEFHFDGQVRGRKVFLQVLNIPVAVTAYDLYATAE